MNISVNRLLFILFLFSATGPTFAQGDISPSPYFSYGKGLGIISPDSVFMLNIRFRMQNRAAFLTESDTDLSIDQVEARVRRLRLRFDGFIYTPKLYYLIQLAFTRADMDFDDTGFPNVVRDAMIIYSFNENFSIGLGQTKLPGNRQRVNSSGDLQLADRSIVNSIFNIDRDFGAQFYYNNSIQKFYYVFRAAVSSGEGRNINASDRGLAYTGRVELLPFGKFMNGGDYFEGDLVREKKPKLSIGTTLSKNMNAIRTGGQLGRFLYEPRDIETFMFDFLFKYRGWAATSELLRRNTFDPITMNTDGDQRYVYVGHGENYQASYLFKTDYELVGRFSRVRPNPEIQLLTPEVKQFTLGVNKYIRGHRLKLQSDLTYEQNNWMKGNVVDFNRWQLRFQIEAGI
ncbi:MAG: porin [Cyclobacteriaceae bacterium]|nr:porin [Cyclobacteriaceae bacterium]UYN87435.1 MAG: porin [Cyclobacteriaceae bacterium]